MTSQSLKTLGGRATQEPQAAQEVRAPHQTQRSRVNRRSLLKTSATLGAHVILSGGLDLVAPPAGWSAAPHLIGAESERPQTLWGVMTSEVRERSAIVWSRADRASEMIVRWSVDPDFKRSVPCKPARALPDDDFTARVLLSDLPPGRRIFYRVHFESLLHSNARSIPIYGELTTPPTDRLTPLRVAWSGDSFGQGYGINPQIGGVTLYDRMLEACPDLFIHCGDRIYADQPLKQVKNGGKGRWYNLLTPEVQKVAEELHEFRGYYRYGLLDAPTRRFAQLTNQLILWDDHELKNDWWPGLQLRDRRYQERSCDMLAARARRAFFDYTPLPRSWMQSPRIYRSASYGPLLEIFGLDGRSARGPNDREAHQLSVYERRSQYLGPDQLSWLKRGLARSNATWKLIACPQPLGLMIGSRGGGYDGISSGELEPRGRELELRDLLHWIKHQRIKNVVWVSADVHYAAAHHFHPSRAVYKDFDPFWEFIAGPINAATMRPHRLDPTFGADRVFLSIPEDRSGRGRSPLYGEQFFGLIDVAPEGDTLSVSLYNQAGERLYKRELRARL